MRREAAEEVAAAELSRLTDVLLREYAGAVPPTRIVTMVAQATDLMRRRNIRGRTLVAMAEQAARRALTDEIARAGSDRLPDGAEAPGVLGRLRLPPAGEIGRLAS